MCATNRSEKVSLRLDQPSILSQPALPSAAIINDPKPVVEPANPSPKPRNTDVKVGGLLDLPIIFLFRYRALLLQLGARSARNARRDRVLGLRRSDVVAQLRDRQSGPAILVTRLRGPWGNGDRGQGGLRYAAGFSRFGGAGRWLLALNPETLWDQKSFLSSRKSHVETDLMDFSLSTMQAGRGAPPGKVTLKQT